MTGDGADVLAAVEAVEPNNRSALADGIRSAVAVGDPVAFALRE